VQQALERLIHGRTVLIIAHRLSTIRRADKIAVLNKGTIVEFGIVCFVDNKISTLKQLSNHIVLSLKEHLTN
jgi:ABC-type bacteriocin/lantibiotic exporter with double-glycine peptidase domain